jgi:hypothetical protein
MPTTHWRTFDMTRNYMLDATLAIVMGMGLGMLLAAGGQKLINAHYQETCRSQKGHALVMITSFLGDAYYCLDKRYL